MIAGLAGFTPAPKRISVHIMSAVINSKYRKLRCGITIALLVAGIISHALAQDNDEYAGEGPVAGNLDGVQIRRILPSDTDPRIRNYNGDGWFHWVFRAPGVPDNGKLVVFLPGTNGKGHPPQDFSKMAAKEGFPVLGLAYPSLVSISVLDGDRNPSAFARARNNIINAETPFGRFRTEQPDCIRSRLHHLIHFLAERQPGEGWGKYLLPDGAIDWSRLILVGQSQGGGHALFMGMEHSVERVLMFGAPKDFNKFHHEPAAWYRRPSATPLNRLFSYVHREDRQGCTYPEQLENYRAVGLLPKYRIVNADESQPPYGGTHLFTATRLFQTSKEAHGYPLFNAVNMPVWKYMLETPVD